MSACTFFGHRDCPESIKHDIYSTVDNLISLNDVRTFYVGNHGNFDRLVISVLKELKILYPDINYYVVLAYLPSKDYGLQKYVTIYPEGIEIVPKRFAIDFRNRWMIDKSDYVVTYIRHNFGGAANATKYANNKGKSMIAT